MNLFYEYIPQRIDLEELKIHPPKEHLYIPANWNGRILHRTINVSELIKYCKNQDDIGDLKEKYLIFDSWTLYNLGYKDIFYKELAPGDTTIVYELEIKDK